MSKGLNERLPGNTRESDLTSNARILHSVSQLMDTAALEVLEDAKSWDWPVGNQGGKFNALIPQLLSCLIKESQGFHGTVLNQFWESVGKCHDKLKDNGPSHPSASELQGLTSTYS